MTEASHLPADIRRALDDFDARIHDGSLPLTAAGHPVIPPAAEAWISEALTAHLPADDFDPAHVTGAPSWGDFRPPSPVTPQQWAALQWAQLSDSTGEVASP